MIHRRSAHRACRSAWEMLVGTTRPTNDVRGIRGIIRQQVHAKLRYGVQNLCELSFQARVLDDSFHTRSGGRHNDVPKVSIRFRKNLIDEGDGIEKVL